MKVKERFLDGVLLIDLECFRDARGFFVERYNRQKFEKLLPAVDFVQDNHSSSVHRTLRGLHFQKGQAKLVTVMRGSISDVVVDIRKGSKTFGEHCIVNLSSENPQLLWVPDGFAHGFCVLSDEGADVFYKTTTHYDSSLESGISYADPDLEIQWPVQSPIVSERDQKLSGFRQLK